MSLLERLGTTGPGLSAAVVSTICVYLVVVLLTRLAGTRPQAKMSSFDVAATVAVGSVSPAEGAAGLRAEALA